ncbi:MAG: response regulator transcription factor [Ignavibacteriales bacterium]|nr:response regulator transcription factor [Ignavibacteriales bacterium]
MNPLTVLIIDDSEIIREKLVSQLSRIPNVSVAGQAGTVADAVRAFNNSSPHVVVLDMQLGDGKGFDVLKEIKRRHGNTTVVMFTNCPALEFRKQSLESGADLFLEKGQGFTVLSDFLSWLARERNRTAQAGM